MSNDPLSINVKPVPVKYRSVGPYFFLFFFSPPASASERVLQAEEEEEEEGEEGPGTKFKHHFTPSNKGANGRDGREGSVTRKGCRR